MRNVFPRIVLATGVCLLASCSHLDGRPATSARVRYLDTGLTPGMRDRFSELPMGTGIFEFHGFMAIRDPKTGDLFSRNLERFGFLPDPQSPSGLPVGMTVERPEGVPFEMIGLNCAACHTAEIHYKGTAFRIDGAPNRIDLFAFKRDLVEAAEHTVHHPKESFALLLQMAEDHKATKKLLREVRSHDALLEQGPLGESLADEVHATVTRDSAARDAREDMAAPEHAFPAGADTGAAPLTRLDAAAGSEFSKHSAEQRERLAKDTLHEWARNVRLFSSWIHIVKKNLGDHSAMTPPGPGRADAWGAVRNVLFEPRPLTAPSSIPPIWGIDDYEWFQWNGTTNTNVQRGFAAAIGAGAYFDRRTAESPIRVDNIMKLESLTKRMRPPRWPEAFPAIDRTKAERGRALYEAHCARCHDAATRSPGGLTRFPEFPVDEIGTDTAYVHNFGTPTDGKPFEAALQEFMGRMEQRYYEAHDVPDATRAQWDPASRRPPQWRAPMAYPARPLAGVWSTAPYLHNDSVPTLYDLLSPVPARPSLFHNGSREFDPGRVGYLSNAGAPDARFVFDTSIVGNSNAGHIYGTELGESQRWDLVEYLKTL